MRKLNTEFLNPTTENQGSLFTPVRANLQFARCEYKHLRCAFPTE